MMESANTAPFRAEEASRASSHPLWWWVGTFAGAFLGCVLLFAVWAKALDPTAFADQIRAEKLDFLFSGEAVALIALAIETGLGLALLLGIRNKWVLGAAALLVAFFVFLTGRAWWLDSQGLLPKDASSCGCFGNLVQRSPAEAFWQDLALLVPALLLAFVGRDRRQPLFPALRTAAALFGTVAVMVFAWMAPDLPLDDLATRLRPGVEVREICAGTGEERVCLPSIVPELKEGEHLVVISNLDDPELTGSIDSLNAYSSSPGNARLWVLSSSPAEEHQAFFWQWGPAFEIRETPSELLRPLYRRLPRAFLLKDGRVTRTFGGLPPLSQLAAHPQESFERSSS